MLTSYHSFSPAEGHGLPHDPIKAIIAPRPIGWVSTLSPQGVRNLAPYSYFNIFYDKPPILIFASDGRKDSVTNIEATGEFVYNLANTAFAAAMNTSSTVCPAAVDEFVLAGLEAEPSDLVAPPRVAGVAAAMECKLVEIQRLRDIHGTLLPSHLVIGQVVRVHINHHCLVDGLFDITRAGTIARCGYRGDYIAVTETFEMVRPKALP